MGMDMFLYKTSKNHRKNRELAKAANKEFLQWCNNDFCNTEVVASIKNLPHLESGTLDWSKMTDEGRKIVARCKSALRKKAHSLGGILRRDLTFAFLVNEDYKDPETGDPETEIGYWRKEYALHKFIINNFGDPKNDNLEEVYLDEESLKKIIEKYPGEECFREALYIVRGGGEVFYKAWY